MDLISTDEHGYYSCITFSDDGEDDIVYDAIPVILDVVDVPNVLEGPARLEDVVAVDVAEFEEERHPYGNYLLYIHLYTYIHFNFNFYVDFYFIIY